MNNFHNRDIGNNLRHKQRIQSAKFWIPNVLTVLIPLIAFILTPWWASKFNPKKEFTYEIVSEVPFSKSNIQQKSWGDIHLTFQDKRIKDATYICVRFENTGNVPIEAKDFESPLVLNLNKMNSILDVKVPFKNPRNLSLFTRKVDSGLIVNPLLLNPGDNFYIEILGIDTAKIASIDSRISGISLIKKFRPEPATGFLIVNSKEVTPGYTDQYIITKIVKSLIPLVTVAFCLNWCFLYVISFSIRNLLVVIVLEIASLVNYLFLMLMMHFSYYHAYELFGRNGRIYMLSIYALFLLSCISNLFPRKILDMLGVDTRTKIQNTHRTDDNEPNGD